LVGDPLKVADMEMFSDSRVQGVVALDENGDQRGKLVKQRKGREEAVGEGFHAVC
jgi:hypothetical protein